MSEGQNGSPQFGLRFEDMSEEELEHYRQFWQEPEPQAGEPGYRLPEQDAVRARTRMATGLSFTLLLFGVLLALICMIAGNELLALTCGVVVLAGLGLLIAVRRRLFPSLRVHGQGPLRKNKKAKWFWLPHSLVIAGILCAIASFTIIPELDAGKDPIVLRTHVLMLNEITMLCLLTAALLYGLLSLAIYTPEDNEDSLVRPTDYAQQQLQRDIDRNKRRDDDFYDSSWITGKDR